VSAVIGAGLAMRAAQAKPPIEPPAPRPGKKLYQASICMDGKVYGGDPNKQPGCKHGFTMVSGWVEYDGNHARLAGKRHCAPIEGGWSNTMTWCGVINNGASPPTMYMSLGANGKFESRGEIQTGDNSSISAGLEGSIETSASGEFGKGNAKVSGEGKNSAGGHLDVQRGHSRQKKHELVYKKEYWIRIDVRPDGTYNLRGGVIG
jgi:hypothetical protein